jgi:hypothetical protein
VRASGLVRDAATRLAYADAAKEIARSSELLLDANLAALESGTWPGASLRFHLEAAQFASSQRSLLREQIRLRLTDFGRRFSDWVERPGKSVAERLRANLAGGMEAEQAYRAIVRSAGRTRGWVNGVAAIGRRLDKGLLGLALVFSIGRVTYNAVYDPANVWNVLYDEGISWAGAAAGCAVGGAVGTVVPIVGNAVGCVIGSIGGGLAGSHYSAEIVGGLGRAATAIDRALEDPAGAGSFPQLVWVP